MRGSCRAHTRGTLLRRSMRMLTMLMIVASYRRLQRAMRRAKDAQ
jgi:hypothetical protein